MNGRNLNKPLVYLVTLVAMVACASQKVESPGKGSKAQDRADTLAGEALVAMQSRDGARALTLMEQAVQQAPQRADLAYLHARLCLQIDGCAPEPLDARLRKVDPTNAVVWVNALAAAQLANDIPAETQVLEAMARSQRFHLYWNPLVANLSLTRIHSGQRPQPALTDTIGWLAGTLVPPLRRFTVGCNQTRTADAQWEQRCRRIANLLMNSDTYIVESLGLKLAKQVTGEAAARAKLDERLRTRRYLWQLSGEIAASHVEKDKLAAKQIELMRTLPREQDVFLAIVRWAGMPTIPPADFTVE
jgi:hypothetical protein